MSLRTEQEEHQNHYAVELELAARLRATPPEARGTAYTAVYDELFQRVPEHPQLRIEPWRREQIVRQRLQFVGKFCRPDGVLLEIGTGDGMFSMLASDRVGRVIGVDVSSEILRLASARPNVEFQLTDGIHLSIETASVDVAFSDQLMEHLHPDDAAAQLSEIARVLRPGGRYVCITPNRATGPHDVSGLFGDETLGFHLREYASQELTDLFRQSGFGRVDYYAGGKGQYFPVPSPVLELLERTLLSLPTGLRRRVRRSLVPNLVLGLNAVATRSG